MIGKKREEVFVVSREDTAVVVGSGTLEVLATPRLVAMMENVAMSIVQDELEANSTTVGISINIKHIAATPVGCSVRVSAIVTNVSGRRIEYKVVAHDNSEKIAEGTHERYIVDIAKFLLKSQNKI